MRRKWRTGEQGSKVMVWHYQLPCTRTQKEGRGSYSDTNWIRSMIHSLETLTVRERRVQ